MSLLLLFGKGPSGPSTPGPPTVKVPVYGRALNLYSASRRRPLVFTHPIIGYIDVPAGGQIINLALAEQQDFVDILKKMLSANPIDTAVVSDGPALSQKRFATENQAVSDSFARTLAKRIADSEDVADTLSKNLKKVLSEQQDASDTSARLFYRFLTDSVTLTDTATAVKITAIIVALFEQQDVSDTLSKNLKKVLTEQQDVADAMARLFYRFIGDSVTFTDAVTAAKITATIMVALSERQDIADSLFKSLRLRPDAEPQVVIDGPSKTLFKAVSGDNVAVSDGLARTLFKALAESQDAADGLRKSFFLSPSEPQALGDAISKAILKFLSDTEYPFSESVTATVSTGPAPVIPAAAFLESILTEIRDATFHAAGIADPEGKTFETKDAGPRTSGVGGPRRISEIIDAISRKAGMKGFKR